VKHHDEWFDGSFAPIVSPKLFEAVQKVLSARERPRKRKSRHDFPFVGIFECGECGSMFTAQWATGKCGGKYRYYRCTKKKGTCSQGYLREDALADQLKERLQTISLCDAYTDYMLSKVETWEHEEKHASQSGVQNLSDNIKASEARMDKLVGAYLDGDISRDIYTKKKDEIMRATLALKEKKKDFGHQGNDWVEPLREWILDTKQATFLSSSSNFPEIASFVKKVGTNPLVRDKSARFGVPAPYQFVAERRHILSSFSRRARSRSDLTEREVSICDPLAWLSELYKEREYVRSSIAALDVLVART